MTILHDFQSGPPPVLCLDDLTAAPTPCEPRVYDFTLARALGYRHARNVRKLIKSSRAELEMHGELVSIVDRSGGIGGTGANRPADDLLPLGTNPKAGRPGTAFYLNEAQALVICTLTRTPIAAQVRGEIIRIFMLHRSRRLRYLARAEREALAAIIQHADVVMAPAAHDIVFAAADDRWRVPYLLAPVTSDILDTLAEFEAEHADLEDEGLDEDDGLAEDCGDTEPNGDERDFSDHPDGDGGIGDLEGLQEQIGNFDDVLERPWVRSHNRTAAEIERDAEAMRETSRRLRTIIDRLSGAAEPAGNIRLVSEWVAFR